jgi:hypothetical protein
MTSIVLIPGVGTPSSDEWPFCSALPWKEFLQSLNHPITLLGYDHGIPSDNHFSWERLLEEGRNLLSTFENFLLNLAVG